MIREKEATTAGNGMKSGDEQHLLRQMPYGMSLGSQVNMTNCVKHRDHFFNRYPSFPSDHVEVLIAYWMMAGYLGPATKFEEDLSKRMSLVDSSSSVECNHEGFCILYNLGFFDLLDFEFSSDGGTYFRFNKYVDHANIHILELERTTYSVDYEATLDSLKKMLAYRHPKAKANNLNALLIRGCEFLSSTTGNGILSQYSTYFNSLVGLTVVEISNSPCSPIDIGIISELIHLKGLNLSHIPNLEILPDNLFRGLRHLRWLIVRWCSKLRSLPSIDGLTKLVVLDLSHCTNLQQPVFIDIRYPHLQMLDLSYTPVFCGFWELSTPKLTHLSLRGSSLNNLLISNKLDNLQVLDLSGCEKLVSLSPFMNVPSLKHLNLSGCTSFTNFHEGLFDQTSCLLDLDLSWTKVEHLPSFSCLTNLEKLSLRGLEIDSVETLASLPSQLLQLDLTGIKVSSSHSQELKLDFLQSFKKLETLNLSCSSVEKLPDIWRLENLQKLILADCPHLKVVPDFRYLRNLLELDLTGMKIHSVEEFNLDQFRLIESSHSHKLRILNLSRSSVEKLPDMSKLVYLEKLLMADCEQLKVVPNLEDNERLKELDLSGLQIRSMEDFNLDFLTNLYYLKILILSHSSVAKLPRMYGLQNLEKLLLADCPQLKVVPHLGNFKNLITLDLSLSDDSSTDNRQIEFGTLDQWDRGLFPLPQSLRKLVLTNRLGIQKLFPNLDQKKKLLPNEKLVNLKFLDLRGTDVADCDSILEAPKVAEIHTFFEQKSHQPSEDKQFDDVSVDLDALISDIQNQFNSAMTTIDTDHQAFKTQLEKLHRDLRYIRLNIDGLKSSRNWKSGKEILLELMDTATDSSLDHFSVNSTTLKLLNRLVVKLKLLVPRTHNQKDDSEALQINQKKNNNKSSSLMRSKNKENTFLANFAKGMPEMVADLLTCYHSLSGIQKQCLLCFSIFPYNEVEDKNTCALKSLLVRRKILTYWWVGEGFIDPHQASATQAHGVNNSKSIEEIGKQILKVLVEKHFIQPVIRKGRESASYYMNPFVHYFVIQRAKEERFFDIDQQTGNLAPHFYLSQRACLLKPQDKFPSSCDLWARHVNSPKKLASFENVNILFNVNDSMVDIKPQWFSKMENLYLLHLGSWGSENADLVEVKDQKFLEDLNRLNKLRLLSLQGLPTIMKLPDSVCHLSNLIILDLKECSYLEELPADIGSLKSLTHLDITNCPLLTKLPKGISLLSKLQVLRGFIITDRYVSRASKDRNASILDCLLEKTKWCSKIQKLFHSRNNDVCTLRDLLKLERLRVLSLVVNISMFPCDEELRVFKEMKQLRKLKILWERNICIEENGNSSTEQGRLTRPSGWKTNLKCFEYCQQSQVDGDDCTEENKHLDNLEKLELWCFPHENAPEWLNPSELKNLEKLYIVGGHLTKLHGSDNNENPWNVKILRLKHLRKLDIQWDVLKNMFPQLTYLEKHQCDKLSTFPCDWEGVWKSAN